MWVDEWVQLFYVNDWLRTHCAHDHQKAVKIFDENETPSRITSKSRIHVWTGWNKIYDFYGGLALIWRFFTEKTSF